MASTKTITKHSSIMFTDIVGYSKMVEKGEEDALFILEEHNQILASIIKNNSGKIINMSSIAGTQGFKNLSGYVLTKAGIIGPCVSQSERKT